MNSPKLPTPVMMFGQAVVYVAFALGLAYLATRPAFTHFDGAKAQILISFAHGGRAKGGCRTRTKEELAKLAPNMRKAVVCSRERVPLVFEMAVDGRVVYAETLMPTGLRGDGPSRTYHKITTSAGLHKLNLKLRDTDRASGFDFVRDVEVELRPRQNLTIDFKAAQGGFILE